MMDHYQIYRQGAAWSTVRPCTLAGEIDRVEQMLASERQRSKPNTWNGWIECAYEFGISPIEIQIKRWNYETRTATVVARWSHGVAIALNSVEWAHLTAAERETSCRLALGSQVSL